MEMPAGSSAGKSEEGEGMHTLKLLPRILVVVRISVKVRITIRRR